MQSRKEEFAGQHAPEIGGDAEAGDTGQHEDEAQQQSRGVVQEGDPGLSQTV